MDAAAEEAALAMSSAGVKRGIMRTKYMKQRTPNRIRFKDEDLVDVETIPRSESEPEKDLYTLYRSLYAYDESKGADPEDLTFRAGEILQVYDEGVSSLL